MSAFRVALTFDAEHSDRPTDIGVSERLIETLRASSVPATYFVQGRWAEAHPATARAIANAGFLVGNHSHYHARMPLLTDAGLAEDIGDAGRAIEDVTGVDPRPWFRCPFGAGARDPRVQAAVTQAGYRHVGWHVAADDWEPSRTAAVIAEEVVEGVRAHGDGAVVLLHAWPESTLVAAPTVISRLTDAGARFVRIDDLDVIPTEPSWT